MADNPGVYEPYRQESILPFLPAAGILVTIGLVTLFVILAAAAIRGDRRGGLWVAPAVAAVVVGVPSVFGLVTSARSWEAADAAARATYIVTVQDWLAGEIEQEFTAAEAESLLAGRELAVRTGDGLLAVQVDLDRANDLLVLATR